MQVLESRVDHTRVVLMLRKAGNLPLVKDYLMAVQKSNLSAVNEAVNELVIEEEDFEVRAGAGAQGLRRRVYGAGFIAQDLGPSTSWTSRRRSLLCMRGGGAGFSVEDQ